MPKAVAIQLLEGFVKENLEIGWSHLEDGNLDLAEHHFHRACEQVAEIRTLITRSAETQPPLLEI